MKVGVTKMNRKQILEWLDRPAKLSREERLVRALAEQSERAARLEMELLEAGLREGGSADE